MTCSPDGRHTTETQDKTIRTWDAKAKVAIAKPLKARSGSVRSTVYCPDGWHVASESPDKIIQSGMPRVRVVLGKPLAVYNSFAAPGFYSPDAVHHLWVRHSSWQSSREVQ